MWYLECTFLYRRKLIGIVVNIGWLKNKRDRVSQSISFGNLAVMSVSVSKVVLARFLSRDTAAQKDTIPVEGLGLNSFKYLRSIFT